MIYQSAKKLSKMIRQKKISAMELANAYLQQIECVNPSINAIAQVDPARIFKEARACDKELSKGQCRGPLHGVPITIKDNLLTKGIITTGGSFAFSNFIPSEDAAVVKRLREAGAIILGKTNLPDFALSWETESTAYGRTNNPYNLDVTSGGSSGGEAAILAVGGSALGIGTDSGGSIRLPAHHCGIAGLRTSRGIIPSTGHMPPTEGYPVLGVFASFNTIGPMARYAEDLIYTLPILVGADGVDPYAEHEPIKNRKKFTLQGLRVAVYSSIDGNSIDPEIAAALRQTAYILGVHGAIVDEVQPPIADARDIYCAIVGADGGEGVRQLLSDLGYVEIPNKTSKSLKLMENEPSLRKFLDASIQWDIFRINFMRFMQPYDIILSPASAFGALPHEQSLVDHEHFKHENYLIPYNLMGWPAAVVRVATSSKGLPIGVQIGAKHKQDYLTLYTARVVEDLMGGWARPRAAQ